MEDGRTPSEDSRVNLGASGSTGNITGLPTTTTAGPTSVSQPGSIMQSNTSGVRDEMSFDSNDSGPLAGFSSNRDPVYQPFNPHLINHTGNPDITGNNSTQNTTPIIINDEEELAKELNSFNSKIQEDDTMKVTTLAKTWMSNLRRITNIKKDFDKTKNSSKIAYSRIISDSTSND